MQASQVPAKFNIAFASGAGGSYVRNIPQASQINVQAGAASLTDGFPPVTFLPVGSGGTPPWGADFNGILRQITQWAQWEGAGALTTFDASFSLAIGGYPKGALLASLTAGNGWMSIVDNNTNNPDAGGAGWVGWSSYGADYAADTGTTNNLVVNLPSNPVAYYKGMLARTTLANNITGPSVINVCNLGNKTISLPGGGDTHNLDYLAGDELLMQYNGTAFIVFTPINKVIIDTHLTYQVHGTGATFPDLISAFTWLNRRRISMLGQVTFNIPAGQYTYSSDLTVSHPDISRSSVTGASSSTYALVATGPHVAADGTTNLANLRTAFPTELHFTGGYSVNFASGAPYLSDILFTGDNTTTFEAGNGVTIQAGPSTSVLNNIAIHGFGGNGLQIQESLVAFTGTLSVVYCAGTNPQATGNITLSYGAQIASSPNAPGLNSYGSGANGISIGNNSAMGLQNSSLNCNGNNSYGLNLQHGAAISASGTTPTTITTNYNGQGGIFNLEGHVYTPYNLVCNNNSNYGINNQSGTITMAGTSSIQNNAGNWGLSNIMGGMVWLIGTVTFNNNPIGSMYAYGSSITRVGPSSTGTSTANPALGVVGNNNALNVAA